MKKTLLFAAIILALLISCNQKYKDEPKIIFAPKSSTEELLKQGMENSLENIKNSEGVYENHLLLINKENVYLRGFGSFIIKERAEKTARNISKNTTIIIPKHSIPSFKPAKTFVNEVK